MYAQVETHYYCSLCHGRYTTHEAAEACEQWQTGEKPCEPGDSVVVRAQLGPNRSRGTQARVLSVELRPLWEDCPGHAWHIQLDSKVDVGPDLRSNVVLGSSIIKTKTT